MPQGFSIEIEETKPFARCMLCGGNARSKPLAWLDIIRVLYKEYGVYGQVVLTGLSTTHHAHKLKEPEDTRITWTRHAHTPVPSVILHEECRLYLERCIGPENMDLGALFTVLRQMVPPKNPFYPVTFGNHPYRTTRLEELLSTTKHIPELPASRVRAFLETPDFLSLRCASRAMAPIFHHNGFWMSRFRSAETNRPLDWRLLYRAPPRARSKLEFQIKVWEVVQWVKDVLRATTRSAPLPIAFAGRALQFYHNESAALGRTVQSARIHPSLTKIAISIVSGPLPSPQEAEQLSGKHRPFSSSWECPTRITGLEFVHQDTGPEMLGSRTARARRRTPNSLQADLDRYIKDTTGRRLCDEDGVGVVVEASATSFKGFRIRHHLDDICSLGILRQRQSAPGQDDLPGTFGYDFAQCTETGIGMERVVEVVGTFEV
ncbi:hypothetical protein BJX61DRAFT_547634 [Aspergillus egyptiacus]|nr:hypothetical protein BJX61DRAFT_547634 [Aspergillus egyptiacus]